MKIIAYRFSALGDVAMTAPVLREVLEQNPDLEIIMVSRMGFRDIFAQIPRLHFHGINLDDYKGVFGLKKLADEIIRQYQPDAIADLHDVIRTKILNRIFKFKGFSVFKIDKGKAEKKHLTNIWNIEKHALKRTTERYADVFRQMGFSVQLSDKLRPKNGKKSGIGIAPFAQHRGKIFPLEKMFEVAKNLSQHDKIYFFGGGKKETEILTEWERLIPNSECLAGKLKLGAELEKIASLKLMISMDSANMHFASLVGTRCISVWGQTHPYAGFLGFGQRIEDAVQITDFTCRPCSIFGDKTCYRDDWACQEEITPEMIIKAVGRYLD